MRPHLTGRPRLYLNCLRRVPALTKARMRTGQSNIWLDLLAIASLAICTLLTLTMAGGTWMFWQLSQVYDATSRIAQISAMLDNLGEPNAERVYFAFTGTYVGLAGVACLLTLTPLVTLSTGAAKVGAFARSKRLAVLRLIGVDATGVRIIALCETFVYIVIGILLGAGLWLLSLPAWSQLTMQGRKLDPSLMLLPTWLLLLIFGIIALLAVFSSVFGLHSVAITPLGVSRQGLSVQIRAWRLFLLIAAVIAAIVLIPKIFSAVFTNYGIVFAAIAVGIVFAVIIGITNLTGPLVLRIVAHFVRIGAGPARMIAMRRIANDPHPAWRAVSGLALVCFITTISSVGSIGIFATASQTQNVPAGERAMTQLLEHDILIGLLITISVTLLVAASSTLIQQCSAVYDQRKTFLAMDALGAPASLWNMARIHEAIWPTLTAVIGSVVLGLALILPLLSQAHALPDPSQVAKFSVVILVGIVLVLGTTLITNRAQRLLLRSRARQND